MFAFVLSIFGFASSLILLPIGFAISVYAPLVVADTANWLYNTLGLNNFAYELFGSNNWISVNLNTILGQFFLWTLIASVATFALVLMIRGAMAFTNTGRKWSVSLGRLTYGIIGIVGVPIVFMFTILVTSTIFQALTPSASFITAAQLESIRNATRANQAAINTIMESTTSVQGTDYTYRELMDKLTEQLTSLQGKASSQGMTSLASDLDNAIKQIGIVKVYDVAW